MTFDERVVLYCVVTQELVILGSLSKGLKTTFVSERSGNNLLGSKYLNLKARPESGLDCLLCAEFARQQT